MFLTVYAIMSIVPHLSTRSHVRIWITSFDMSLMLQSEAAGKSMIGVRIDHIFLCIKDAGEWSYSLISLLLSWFMHDGSCIALILKIIWMWIIPSKQEMAPDSQSQFASIRDKPTQTCGLCRISSWVSAAIPTICAGMSDTNLPPIFAKFQLHKIF